MQWPGSWQLVCSNSSSHRCRKWRWRSQSDLAADSTESPGSQRQQGPAPARQQFTSTRLLVSSSHRWRIIRRQKDWSVRRIGFHAISAVSTQSNFYSVFCVFFKPCVTSRPQHPTSTGPSRTCRDAPPRWLATGWWSRRKWTLQSRGWSRHLQSCRAGASTCTVKSRQNSRFVLRWSKEVGASWPNNSLCTEVQCVDF